MISPFSPASHATPYNKTYLDISSQLRLFLSDEACRDLGIRPEKQLGELGEAKFNSRYQCPVRSLMAFEQSEHADDWRELMRHYLVRRTRSFIQENYARTDLATGRKYLEFSDGTRSYFPVRTPKTVRFLLNSEQQQAEDDPYALLYSDRVVTTINELNLPRYGLANYIVTKPKTIGGEAQILSSLSRGGKRLMGFCRTNLFKRLESGGPAFIQSLERHVLRNFIFLYAIENGLDLPIGTQNLELLDTRTNDQDNETVLPETLDEGDASTQDMTVVDELTAEEPTSQSEAGYRKRAAVIYNQYTTQFHKRFKWIRPVLFNTHLKKDLLQDARKLLQILNECGTWAVTKDAKLIALIDLLTQSHPNEKILIFTQFADTVHYLTTQLQANGIAAVEGVTGDSEDPTTTAGVFGLFTTFSDHTLDMERFFQVSRCQVSPFSEKFHSSVKIWSALRLIYHEAYMQQFEGIVVEDRGGKPVQDHSNRKRKNRAS